MTAHSVTSRFWRGRSGGHLRPIQLLERSASLRTPSTTPPLRFIRNPNFRHSGVSAFRTGFVGRMPSTALTTGTPSTLRAGSQAASAVAERRALRKLAGRLRVPRLGPIGAAALAAELFYKVYIEPDNFPGFDNITAGWRKPVVGPSYAPGAYVPNPFDYGSFDNPPESLLDTDDTIFPSWIRYWGDFGTNPYPVNRPADNWETSTRVMPSTTPRGRVRYRRLPNLATQTQPWHPRSNIEFTISTAFREPAIRLNVQRKRSDDGKAKPANQFIYGVLRALVDFGGETKEWLDILAEASHYHPRSKLIPRELWGNETQKKFWWLFIAGGINHLDWDQLAVLVIENEIEDRIYGALGQLSKSAAQSLNLTVGPQTGLVM